jgi:Skp family chaperone for outer membrane proteins
VQVQGDGADGVAPKELKALADAFRSAQQAQNMSSERRAKEDAKLAARVTEAVDTVAKAKGLTGETTEAIKKQILGVA